MIIKLRYSFLLLICLSVGSVAQVTSVRTPTNFSDRLTGNFRFDLERLQAQDSVEFDQTDARKSALRAALYSAILPGAGEFYIGEYWRATAFLAVEAAFWATYAIYDSRGDRQTRLFEQFADDHFSVVKYADWMMLYGSQLNPNLNPADCQGIVTSNDPRLRPWERIDWEKLNRCEEAIGAKSGTGFTHRLPRRPDQQYYELIGKYEQYSSGWDDANVDATNYLTNLSANFLRYSDMRGKANDLYNIATTFSYLLVANHLLSALDAAFLAAQHNKHLSLKAYLRPTTREYGFIEFVPTATLTVGF